MSFDTSMAALSLRLIAKRGKTITYTQVTQGAYVPGTGAATTTETATTFKALVEEYSGMAFLSGLIIEGDKHITIAASSLTVAPVPGDKITVDSNIYTVQSVKVAYAGELPVLYDLRART